MSQAGPPGQLGGLLIFGLRLVSRFRSSHHIAATFLCELRNQRDTSNVMILVRFWI
jgi:hypothetical protein